MKTENPKLLKKCNGYKRQLASEQFVKNRKVMQDAMIAARK